MNEFRDGWGTLVAAVIGTMCGLITITNYSQGFFVGPVSQEFGWTPPQFFFGFTVMMCSGLIAGPLVGAIAQKVGLKIVGLVGLLGHAVGYYIISKNNGDLTTWYLSWGLLSFMAAGSLPIIWVAGLNGFFRKHRGKAIGITMAGTGMGAFIIPPIVEHVIANDGWRAAYQTIAFGALLVSLPIIVLLFKVRSSEESDGDLTESSWGYTRAEALRHRKFWILAAVLFITVIVVVGLLSNFEQIMGSKGFERSDIAILASVLGISVILGRLLVGALVDRFWAPAVACLFFSFPALGMYLLINGDLNTSIAVGVAIFIGLAAGAELDMLAYLTGRYFGPAHYPAVFGCVYAAFTLGAGVGPSIFGGSAESNGGYDPIMTLSIGLLFVSMVLFLLLGRYPEQSNIEAG